jgi:hypothetical protein
MEELAIVLGDVPGPESIEVWEGLKQLFHITVITNEPIAKILQEQLIWPDLKYKTLKEYKDGYIPGLEEALSSYPYVFLKERIGVYAYQVVKAKSRYGFCLWIGEDHSVFLAGEEDATLRTIREEVTAAADAFLVQDPAVHRRLQAEGVQKIIDLPWVGRSRSTKEDYEKVRKIFNWQGPVLLYVGPLEWEEGLEEPLWALKEHDLHLALWGTGSYENSLKRLAVKLGVTHKITWLPWNQKSYLQAWAGCDGLYINPMGSQGKPSHRSPKHPHPKTL